jgi:hypothetical protein
LLVIQSDELITSDAAAIFPRPPPGDEIPATEELEETTGPVPPLVGGVVLAGPRLPIVGGVVLSGLDIIN